MSHKRRTFSKVCLLGKCVFLPNSRFPILPSPAIDWKIWKALYSHGCFVCRLVVLHTFDSSDVTLDSGLDRTRLDWTEFLPLLHVEIILNLYVGGEEEGKRTVLTSSRKRADILYPLKWKSIVFVFNKFVCLILFIRCKSGFLKQTNHKCNY